MLSRLCRRSYGGCQFKDVKIYEPNLRYQALRNKDVDVTQAFGTDGQISGDNLVLLTDPKNWGPPDNVAPIIRDYVLAAYPQIADVLNKVSAKITNDEISKLNWQVDGQGKDAHDVAKQWLYDQGLSSKVADRVKMGDAGIEVPAGEWGCPHFLPLSQNVGPALARSNLTS